MHPMSARKLYDEVTKFRWLILQLLLTQILLQSVSFNPVASQISLLPGHLSFLSSALLNLIPSCDLYLKLDP